MKKLLLFAITNLIWAAQYNLGVTVLNQEILYFDAQQSQKSSAFLNSLQITPKITLIFEALYLNTEPNFDSKIINCSQSLVENLSDQEYFTPLTSMNTIFDAIDYSSDAEIILQTDTFITSDELQIENELISTPKNNEINNAQSEQDQFVNDSQEIMDFSKDETPQEISIEVKSIEHKQFQMLELNEIESKTQLAIEEANKLKTRKQIAIQAIRSIIQRKRKESALIARIVQIEKDETNTRTNLIFQIENNYNELMETFFENTFPLFITTETSARNHIFKDAMKSTEFTSYAADINSFAKRSQKKIEDLIQNMKRKIEAAQTEEMLCFNAIKLMHHEEMKGIEEEINKKNALLTKSKEYLQLRTYQEKKILEEASAQILSAQAFLDLMNNQEKSRNEIYQTATRSNHSTHASQLNSFARTSSRNMQILVNQENQSRIILANEEEEKIKHMKNMQILLKQKQKDETNRRIAAMQTNNMLLQLFKDFESRKQSIEMTEKISMGMIHDDARISIISIQIQREQREFDRIREIEDRALHEKRKKNLEAQEKELIAKHEKTMLKEMFDKASYYLSIIDELYKAALTPKKKSANDHLSSGMLEFAMPARELAKKRIKGGPEYCCNLYMLKIPVLELKALGIESNNHITKYIQTLPNEAAKKKATSKYTTRFTHTARRHDEPLSARGKTFADTLPKLLEEMNKNNPSKK